jgi:hypothetical protein
MVANCGLTGVDGRLNLLLPGGQTGKDWLLVGTKKFRYVPNVLSPCLHPHYIEAVLKWLLESKPFIVIW